MTRSPLQTRAKAPQRNPNVGPMAAHRRLPPFVLLAVTLLALWVPASSEATRKKAMWGPIDFNGVSQFPIYKELGVGIYQMHLSWAGTARTRPANPRDPADPAYAWPLQIDRAIGEGGAQGIQVSVLVMQTPPWANGGREWRWAPTRPQDYADFLEAASRRYPQVRHWMIWSEPTKADNFQPLSPDGSRRLRGRALRGPRLYAQMLDRAYAALKRVSRRNIVIGGNTFTVGTVSPLRFIQALRLPNGKPPRMDLFGHNPFSARTPKLSQRPLGRGYADISDLDTLTKWLDRNLRRKKAGCTVDGCGCSSPRCRSRPTTPTSSSTSTLSQKTQADWIRRALRIARRWKRIYTFGYLGLYDDPVRPAGDQVERGLIERSGRRKPGFTAFKRG